MSFALPGSLQPAVASRVLARHVFIALHGLLSPALLVRAGFIATWYSAFAYGAVLLLALFGQDTLGVLLLKALPVLGFSALCSAALSKARPEEEGVELLHELRRSANGNLAILAATEVLAAAAALMLGPVATLAVVSAGLGMHVHWAQRQQHRLEQLAHLSA